MHPWNTERCTAIITTRRHTLTHTKGHTHAYVQLRSVYGTTPITAFATVVTAITVAAIKGQDGCSFSKIDSNKHLPENSTNPKEQLTALSVPVQLVWIIMHSQNHPDWVRRKSHTAQKSISTNETAINHKYMYFFKWFHLLLHTQGCSCFKHKHTQMPVLELTADYSLSLDS